MKKHNLLILTIASLFAVNTFAQTWELKDPGGGGAVPAIAVMDNSDIVYVGSDVGGIRHSNDRAASYEPVNYGIPGAESGKNICEMEVFNQGEEDVVFAATTGGKIMWDTVKTNHYDIVWKTVFNKDIDWGISDPLGFGPIESNHNGTKIYVGIGNLNKLNDDIYITQPNNKAGTILIFDVDYTSGVSINSTPTEINIFTLLGEAVVSNCQVTDISATGFTDNSFWVSTTTGIYKITDAGNGNYTCTSKYGSGLLDNRVLSVTVSNDDVNDVVILVHEDPDNLTGGIWHTTNGESASPEWINKTGATKFHKNECVKLVRSKNNPNEAVGVGKYGVFYTADISKSTSEVLWEKIMAVDFVIQPGYDGWVRTEGTKHRGAHAVALRENTAGIEEIYFAGFQGFIFKLEKEGSTFNNSQIYTNQQADGSYKGRGIPLMVNHQIEINPDNNQQVYFLYGDNNFFVSNNSGDTFFRPYAVWSYGHDLLWGDSGNEVYICLSIGNHPGDFNGGSIIKTTDSGKNWTIAGGGDAKTNGLPNAAITSITKYNGKIYTTAFENGLYSFDGTSWNLEGFSGKPVFNTTSAPDVSVNNEEVLFACLNEVTGGELLYYYYNNTWTAFGSAMQSMVKNNENRLKYDNGNLMVFDGIGNSAFAKTDDISSVADLQSLTWHDFDLKIYDITYCPVANKYYAATKENGILYTSDLTQPANEWASLTDEGLFGWKRFLAVNVDSEGNIYAGGANGVYRIENSSAGISFEKKYYNSLKVYPNPADSKLTIELAGVNEKVQNIKIIDVRGAVVFKQDNTDGLNKYTLDISNWHSGVYVVSAEGKDNVYTGKLIVK